jgi:tetratricopeptide (TPR) repeat protein
MDSEYKTYSRAIARGTDGPPMDIIYVNQGLILGNQGRHKESIELFRKSLKIADSYDAHYNLGISLGRMGLKEEAAREFTLAERFMRQGL